MQLAQFDKYIFCEQDQSKLDALRLRVERGYPTIEASFICGDSNRIVDEILSQVPTPSSQYKVLSFCFADPYKANNLNFDTIRAISRIFVDFLILVPIFMDMNRTKDYHTEHIDKFVGTTQWRNEWKEAKQKNESFGDFFTKYYRRRMEMLDYRFGGYSEIIRSATKNLPLYQLGFFSRHPLGGEFWKKAVIGSNPQLSLDL